MTSRFVLLMPQLFFSPVENICRSRHVKSDECSGAFNASMWQRYPIDYQPCFEPFESPSSYLNTPSPCKVYWPTGSRLSVLASPRRKSLTPSSSLRDSGSLSSALSSKGVVYPSLPEEGWQLVLRKHPKSSLLLFCTRTDRYFKCGLRGHLKSFCRFILIYYELRNCLGLNTHF